MSMRLLIVLAAFLVANGFMTLGRMAFYRAIAAANEKLPADEAIVSRRALLQWRTVRRKLRMFEDSSKALTRSDLMHGVGTLGLVAILVYLVATWGEL